jgi:cytochrome c peroxidase
MVPVKKIYIFFIIVLIIALYSFVVIEPDNAGKYLSNYTESINKFSNNQRALSELIKKTDFSSASGIEDIRKQIAVSRTSLKGIDFWLRYLDPIAYKKINGPLPVEWETEVFEKFEKPYKREGAGLTLAALYLEEKNAAKDSLVNLVASSIAATQKFMADSVTDQLQNHHHFFLANRLFLLNLAAIYTTGFECPDTSAIIPELHSMLVNVKRIYSSFNESFPATPVSENFLTLYNDAIAFVNKQPVAYSKFDHFIFIRDYVNPLFKLNQQFINQYRVFTKNYVDYSLNNSSQSIFSKQLYFGQNTKGVFLRVNGEKELKEIESIGKLLFYDPLLSGNNKRSCNSCHKPAEYFTDTTGATSFQYDGKNYLPRNSPSLINATYNHLLMLDGKHISTQNQAKDVITNALELGSNENELVQKVLSCTEYKKAFKSFLKYTPQEKEITLDHIVSAITMYYGKFSNYYAPFDDAMNKSEEIELPVKEGFNLFMSKAQCGTCHFVPQFNGVKPPYISSEFEVLGVPADTVFKKLSIDKGRYDINPAGEMLNAFRTGSIRNAAYTKPYMHNGVFNTLEQVIDFYNAGGGVGKGLKINNQTLSADSLKLTAGEKMNLIVFIRSLNENINFEKAPGKLPASKNKLLSNRKIGGDY